MRGGIDQGWCLLPQRLSYRRKAIRSPWGIPIMIGLILLARSTGFGRLPHDHWVWWYGIAQAVIVQGGTSAYYFRQWRREVTANSLVVASGK